MTLWDVVLRLALISALTFCQEAACEPGLPREIRGIWAGWFEPSNITLGDFGVPRQCAEWTAETETAYWIYQGRPTLMSDLEKCLNTTFADYVAAPPELGRFIAGPGVEFNCNGTGQGEIFMAFESVPPGPLGQVLEVCVFFERTEDEVGPILNLNWGRTDFTDPEDRERVVCPRGIDDRDTMFHSSFQKNRPVNDISTSIDFSCP